MTKAELLAELAAKGLRVIATEQEADPVKEAANVRQYIANVLAEEGNIVRARNIGFYVIDEGQPGEAAYYRDRPHERSQTRMAAEAYLRTLVPGTYIRTQLDVVEEADRYAFARAWKDGGGLVATEVRLIIWKNGANPVEHRELT